MNTKKDLIIGGVDNYDSSKLKNWARSANKCGFKGDKILIAYRIENDTIKFMQDEGFEVYKMEYDYFNNTIEHNVKGRDTQSHQIRFYHIWEILNRLGVDNYNNVIATDVKDVIFQTDPSPWLEKTLVNGIELIAPSECVHYKHENWNASNMVNGFGPYIWELMAKEFLICNVGTIAGKSRSFSELCLMIYLTSVGHYIPSDQSSFNILINTLLKNKTKITSIEDGWCCNCALTFEPQYVHSVSKFLTEPPPKIHDDGYFYNSKNELLCLVHQYERVPGLEPIINKRYA